MSGGAALAKRRKAIWPGAFFHMRWMTVPTGNAMSPVARRQSEISVRNARASGSPNDSWSNCSAMLSTLSFATSGAREATTTSRFHGVSGLGVWLSDSVASAAASAACKTCTAF